MVRFPDLAFDAALSEFAEDVVAGLSARPRTLPCKYFYDARGSELFEEITDLPEYYPTRTEIGILRERARDICAQLAPGSALIEYGSGSSIKTEILLAAGDFAAYAPIDISPSALHDAAHRLRRRFPDLRVEPVIADFVADVVLPDALNGLPRVGFFPGSTIGNFAPADARALLRRMARQLGPGAKLVVGVDLRKSPDILIPAYDDAQGVTAAFNLNLLVRLRDELGADIQIDGFRHRAIWNARDSRIEMHLAATGPQTIRVAGHEFSFDAGETIHTENSCKYGIADFEEIARAAGWRALETFVDAGNLFSVKILEVQ